MTEKKKKMKTKVVKIIKVDLDNLADMIFALVEGGIIISKVVKDKEALPNQILAYRDFIRTVFVEP